MGKNFFEKMKDYVENIEMMGLFDGIAFTAVEHLDESFTEFSDKVDHGFEKLEVVFADVELEGKKQGYKKAADAYEEAFGKIENAYKVVMNIIEDQKNKYDKDIEDLIKCLESLEKEKTVLQQNTIQRAKAISIQYNIPVEKVQYVAIVGYSELESLSILDIVYMHKEKKLRDAERQGYMEAKETYEIKLKSLQDKLHMLIQKGNEEIKSLEETVDIALKSITEEQMKIAQWNIIFEGEQG